MVERTIDITGTPEDVRAMLNAASKIEPGIYRKRKNSPGSYTLWYRGDGPPNDLLRAIKHRAGLIKVRNQGKSKAKRAEQEAE